MAIYKRRRLVTEILLSLSIFVAVGLGIGVGISIAATDNVQESGSFDNSETFLPTQILDRNGKLIAQFFGAEKREPVPLDELPKYLIYALITREDQDFFHEHGFSLKGTLRAAWNIVTGQYVSGGSTITQQLAGTLLADRSQKTIFRKIKELWFAIQLEKRYTKDQILEMYLNTAYFGRNNYGVEAASQFYFGHSARDLTLAESVMLVIQLANPARYYPLKYPNRARTIQRLVLDEMVQKNYVTRADADESFNDYWANYDYTRSNTPSLASENGSKAPYFTDYVRQTLEEDLFGKLSYLRDGLTVHTTLDLDYQETADSLMKDATARYNDIYQAQAKRLFTSVNHTYYPVVNLLALSFDLNGVARTNGTRSEHEAMESYLTRINPVVDSLSLMLGLGGVENAALAAHGEKVQKEEETKVEGALITLDNHTGEILAMVGGSDYTTSQFNRAVDAKIQPGSAFKPLYYSAALSSGKFTAATRIYDGPIVFYNADGTPYRPYDYLGEWKGSVLLRNALGDSMNVPSLQVLDGIGFDAAIDRASKLLGMEQYRNDPDVFPHVYPLGLGITPLAPINMARAYAVFANQGEEVVPVAIKYVQDRDGNIILEPEKEVMTELKRKGAAAQILSPQVAYVMISLLEGVVNDGTLTWAKWRVGGFDGMPMAGKTGTTQNWSDAWTIGFSPYYTTAVWFGFDRRGGSLGLSLTGATAAGPVWARYMKDIDRGLPRIDFTRPTSGLVEERVDNTSGLLPTAESTGTHEEIFIAGTEPHRFDNVDSFREARDDEILQKLQNAEAIQAAPDSGGASPDQNLPPPPEGSEESLLGTGQTVGQDNGGGQGEPAATPAPRRQPSAADNPLLD